MLTNADKFRSDPPAQHDGQFHWDYLRDAFFRATGRRIEPMDIDAHVEVGGHHLIFETKDDGVPIPDGQRRALMQLWAKGYHTLIFLWGKREPIECEIYWPVGQKKEIFRGQLTIRRVVDICERWARWADGKPAPFQYKDPTT